MLRDTGMCTAVAVTGCRQGAADAGDLRITRCPTLIRASPHASASEAPSLVTGVLGRRGPERAATKRAGIETPTETTSDEPAYGHDGGNRDLISDTPGSAVTASWHPEPRSGSHQADDRTKLRNAREYLPRGEGVQGVHVGCRRGWRAGGRGRPPTHCGLGRTNLWPTSDWLDSEERPISLRDWLEFAHNNAALRQEGHLDLHSVGRQPVFIWGSLDSVAVRLHWCEGRVILSGAHAVWTWSAWLTSQPNCPRS